MRLQQFGFCLLFFMVGVFSTGENVNSSNNGKWATTGEIPHHFHEGDNENENQRGGTHDHDPNSVFHVLINTFNVADDPSKDSSDDRTSIGDSSGLSKDQEISSSSVPGIEMDKLKSAAKNAGLTQAKADRVARAAEAMNMQYNDIVELRKMLNNPATSAEYAEKVRRALEDAVVEQALKNNALPNYGANAIPGQNQQVSANDPSGTHNEKIQDPLKITANQNQPSQNNPFHRNFQPSDMLTGLPPPEKLFENFPFPPPLPPLFRAFALPPGLFGTNPVEKSPSLDLLKAATPIIGSKNAYRLTVICHDLGLPKEEILDLQHQFSDLTMTKEKGLKILNSYENRLSEASKAKLATPNLDPVTLQHLKSMSTMSGLDEHSANRLVRAVMEAQLDPDQVMKFSHTIQETAPSAKDLNKIADHLESEAKNKQTIDQNSSYSSNTREALHDEEWSNDQQAKGADWLFAKADGKDEEAGRETRSLHLDSGEQIPRNQLKLFTAKKYCGFSPVVEPSRLSNTSPGQFPWTGAVLSSRDEFLCFGTLLSESIVICPASCILKYNEETRNQEAMKVVFSYSMMEPHEEHFPPLTVYVASAILHPLGENNYLDAARGDHNIALLRLTANVDFDFYPHIFPICTIGSTYEKYAGNHNCRVLYWPHLPNMETWRPRTYLSSADVSVINRPNCGGQGSHICVTGQVCGANVGSPIICIANSQRYYIWGIINSDYNCDRGSTVTFPVTSVLNSYEDFISKYLFTSNPTIQASHMQNDPHFSQPPQETNDIKSW